MNTRDQILLINLLIDHIKSKKKELKNEMEIEYSEWWNESRDEETMDNAAWGVCNIFGDVIALRADIAKLLQIRRELQ